MVKFIVFGRDERVKLMRAGGKWAPSEHQPFGFGGGRWRQRRPADLEGLSESPSLDRRLPREQGRYAAAGQVALRPSLAAGRQCVLENVHVNKAACGCKWPSCWRWAARWGRAPRTSASSARSSRWTRPTTRPASRSPARSARRTSSSRPNSKASTAAPGATAASSGEF